MYFRVRRKSSPIFTEKQVNIYLRENLIEEAHVCVRVGGNNG